MKKDANKFTLYTDADGNELHLAKGGAGNWYCEELEAAKLEVTDAKIDIQTLLMAVTSANEPNFAAVEQMAAKHGFAFNDDGQVIRSS